MACGTQFFVQASGPPRRVPGRLGAAHRYHRLPQWRYDDATPVLFESAISMFSIKLFLVTLAAQVVPVQHANALDGVPRIAAVFQNDCLYLAHHMVTLGHEFRQGLPPPANETATFIDTVPLFRELAAQRYVMYVVCCVLVCFMR